MWIKNRNSAILFVKYIICLFYVRRNTTIA